MSASTEEVGEHSDAVGPAHRFDYVAYRGAVWDLTHLDAFALRVNISKDPATELMVDVVVLFSFHCFTTEHGDDGQQVLASDYFESDEEVRVLSEERYQLSRQFLRQMVRQLPERRIQVADSERNFFTMEVLDAGHQYNGVYAVFFEVEKDKKRKKRLLLRVQTAYRMPQLSERLQKAGKVNFRVLVRAAYLGNGIKG